MSNDNTPTPATAEPPAIPQSPAAETPAGVLPAPPAPGMAYHVLCLEDAGYHATHTEHATIDAAVITLRSRLLGGQPKPSQVFVFWGARCMLHGNSAGRYRLSNPLTPAQPPINIDPDDDFVELPPGMVTRPVLVGNVLDVPTHAGTGTVGVAADVLDDETPEDSE